MALFLFNIYAMLHHAFYAYHYNISNYILRIISCQIYLLLTSLITMIKLPSNSIRFTAHNVLPDDVIRKIDAYQITSHGKLNVVVFILCYNLYRKDALHAIK